MSNSAQSAKGRLKNIPKEKSVNFNSIMRSYVYDSLIEQLSKSEYRDNPVVRGFASPHSFTLRTETRWISTLPCGTKF